MGLLTTLREWFGGLLGSSGEGDDEADEEKAGSESAGPAGSDEDRLDPGAVTETRSTANDDAVDKLREVRRGPPDSGSDDETDPTESGVDDGKR